MEGHSACVRGVRGVLWLCADIVRCAGMCVRRGRGCGSAFAPSHEMLGEIRGGGGTFRGKQMISP